MKRISTEIVRIGVGGARITSVTREKVDYLDETERQLEIDLEKCAEGWDHYMREHWDEFIHGIPTGFHLLNSKVKFTCVGDRNAKAQAPWARFFNERYTRFEFRAGHELHGLLHRPLLHVGRYMFDLT